MILSNVEIHRALDERRLIIEPEPLPRIPSPELPCAYDTHSVDLKLGDEIQIPKSGQMAYDLTRPGKASETIKGNSDSYRLTSSQPWYLKPNQFALGITRERIALPIQADPDRTLAARIEGKSSRARLGLLVHFTAPTVHPGWDGPLALEMINLGPTPILLVPDMHIAQLILEEVRGVPFANPSQFHGQKKPDGT
jgi:dCTP deaminase